MITVEPKGSITLCHTPLEADYKNQLTFANATKQREYFESVAVNTFIGEDYTYIRKDNQIKIQKPIDDIINCNYLYYTNTGFTTKMYYCFITKMEYVNENTTLVTFQTDCFQTYQFDIVYNNCFVEREHVNDDTIGLHTVPEGLETGEYIVNTKTYDNRFDECKYIVQTTEWVGMDKPYATNYGGIYMAGGAYICDNITAVVSILNALADAGKNDAVYNVYMVPSVLINNTSQSAQYSGQDDPIYLTETITKPSNINGYTPINKKLLTFPYNYLLVSNNNGSSNIYKYERFNGTNCEFSIKGVPVVGGSIKINPSNYDNINNEEEGLILGKFPTLNWSTDEYINWLRRNSINIEVGVGASVLSLVGGTAMLATGNIAGGAMAYSGILGIANKLGNVYQHSLQPNSARGNVVGGDINTCSSSNGIYFYSMSIKEEYARIIDNFFSMFGYKVNRVKTPNITGRTNWNYVKTIDCNFDGNIPQDDLKIIKSMFDNGVTMWHNPNTFYDYSQNNAII